MIASSSLFSLAQSITAFGILFSSLISPQNAYAFLRNGYVRSYNSLVHATLSSAF